jgi:prepilin-type N-terminal cleavage/methylation domain-containing protein
MIKKGFSLIELLITLTLGVIVLTALMSFFFRTSKVIDKDQNRVKDLNQLQFVLNKIVEEVKSANTLLPDNGTALTQSSWNQLPHLPYGRTFTSIIVDPDNSLPRISPYYPLAYNFPSQAGQSGTEHGWYPKPSSEDESNQLVFYKIEKDGSVTRILYYLEIDQKDYNSAKTYLLKKRIQKNITSTSTNYFVNDSSVSENTILAGVKSLQFTYPLIENFLDSSSPEYNASLKSQLLSLNGTLSEKIHKQNELLNKYRNIIGIKIKIAGEQIGNKRATALELSTEVNVRN